MQISHIKTKRKRKESETHWILTSFMLSQSRAKLILYWFIIPGAMLQTEQKFGVLDLCTILHIIQTSCSSECII